MRQTFLSCRKTQRRAPRVIATSPSSTYMEALNNRLLRIGKADPNSDHPAINISKAKKNSENRMALQAPPQAGKNQTNEQERENAAQSFSGQERERDPTSPRIAEPHKSHNLLQVARADADPSPEILARFRPFQLRGRDCGILNSAETVQDDRHREYEVIVDRVLWKRRPRRAAEQVEGAMCAHGARKGVLPGANVGLIPPIGCLTFIAGEHH